MMGLAVTLLYSKQENHSLLKSQGNVLIIQHKMATSIIVLFSIGKCSCYNYGRGIGIRDPAKHNWQATLRPGWRINKFN